MTLSKAKQPPLDRDGITQLLFDVGRHQLKLDALELELNQELAAVTRRYADRLERARAARDEAARTLRLACEDSRANLLPGTAKSLKLLFGVVGWRTQGDRVTTADGVTETAAAERLLEAGHWACVRMVPALEKDKIKAALKAGEIAPSALARCGVRVTPGGEDWYYRLDRERIKQTMEES